MKRALQLINNNDFTSENRHPPPVNSVADGARLFSSVP